MISSDLLKLYFATAIDLRISARFPWRRIYEEQRLYGDVVSEFAGRFLASNPTGCGSSDIYLHSGTCDLSSISILTAWNPRGVEASGLENDLANRRLLEELQMLGFIYGITLFDARGLDSTPGSSYYEVGYAIVEGEVGISVEVARRYDQLAIYKVNDDRLSVVDCQDGRIHTC